MDDAVATLHAGLAQGTPGAVCSCAQKEWRVSSSCSSFVAIRPPCKGSDNLTFAQRLHQRNRWGAGTPAVSGATTVSGTVLRWALQFRSNRGRRPDFYFEHATRET